MHNRAIVLFLYGAERQKELLEKEGHAIIKKGKRYYVKDYKEGLV